MRQAGIAEAAKPTTSKEVVAETSDAPEVRKLSADLRQVPAPVRQAPVQQVPAPVRQAPVQQVPAPVRQAPAPAPAPAQQAPVAPPVITIDLGGRAPVVPQAPIAPKQLHIG
ncbi:hypothetical protein [Rhodococcus sp. IEGM 1408]|uniref:hypothetical protein n=1 Tax=Rhodococcus sp. IEGM 1408 TaxID=3082220 RepID=UPI0029558067|nr:hypothetical protein [Rhodococcus sp. IEGM 1408]MDV8002854.1 hypothetical protein [Rhodococcus sp. IEGM 1408]